MYGLWLIFDTILEKPVQNDQIKLSLLGLIVNDIRIRDTAVAVALRAGLTPDG